jgi:hypothetical protein
MNSWICWPQNFYVQIQRNEFLFRDCYWESYEVNETWIMFGPLSCFIHLRFSIFDFFQKNYVDFLQLAFLESNNCVSWFLYCQLDLYDDLKHCLSWWVLRPVFPQLWFCRRHYHRYQKMLSRTRNVSASLNSLITAIPQLKDCRKCYWRLQICNLRCITAWAKFGCCFILSDVRWHSDVLLKDWCR